MTYSGANTTSGYAYGDNYYMSGTWGTFNSNLYAMSTYWTTSTTATTNVTTKFTL